MRGPVADFFKQMAKATPESIEAGKFKVTLKQASEAEANAAQLAPVPAPALGPAPQQWVVPDVAEARAEVLPAGWVVSEPEKVAASNESLRRLQELERDLVQYVPVGAVLAAWKKLEAAMRAALQRVAPDARASTLGAGRLARVLESQSVINPELRVSIDKLFTARNEAAHGKAEDISTKDAAEFDEIAEGAIRQVELGVEIVRGAQILQTLMATDIKQLVVGRLIKDPQPDTPPSSLRKWVARIESRAMAISEEDATMLLRLGAKMEEPSSPG